MTTVEQGLATIDACVHYGWVDQDEILGYFSEGWNEFVGRPTPGVPGSGRIRVFPAKSFRHPTFSGPDAFASSPAGTASLSEWFSSNGIDKGVLVPDGALGAPMIANYYLAQEACRAVNDWTIDRWLSGQDKRYSGLVMVSNQVPEHAIAEIKRVGSRPGMVGVVLGGNGLGDAFGHLNYHGIYAAAAELGLPIVIHVGGDAVPDSKTSTAPAGYPSTFSEYSIMSVAPLMTHLVSLLLHGVFEKFPTLKVMIVGGGISWLPPLMWRLDTNWRAVRREVPWVKKHPSEYLAEHVRLSSWPFELPASDRSTGGYSALEIAEQLLCYGSGAPYWNTQSPQDVASRIPEAWHDRVFRTNAEGFFRWA